MQAIRVHPSQPPSPPYTPSNPASSTSLHLDKTPIPTPKEPGSVLIRIKASTIIRDMLTWPETYAHPYSIPGNDFAGTVVQVVPGPGGQSAFQVGDEVFGMVHADRPCTWAEYAVVLESEVARKPVAVGWEGAAALPLSGMTGFEALFEHGGLDLPDWGDSSSVETKEKQKEVLITGAAGGVGIYLVQLAAAAAGVRVTAASSSSARNGEFLRELGAHEVIEYSALEGVKGRFDVIIDTVGGETLARCWEYVRDGGSLVSVDSASYDFVEEHRKKGIARDGVKALFFIVRGSSRALSFLGELVDRGLLKAFVAGSYPIDRAREAYDFANGRYTGRGKVVLTL
ncbi:uncharacterized protein N7496_009875 [Penicillium cataractarum]|uniref:Enoyl reductase (ER) domain-containing protein n=1 Tax=Penicillium cataractarum TaxID=2100454 RepID=A0A9W9RPT3_9EURO|nr:uncharacterized protein N7496_009875 [Penicillium cataractarum]KAJ5364162.1 hypothetical protein N7496_009875 [Penicillium cataractarum]